MPHKACAGGNAFAGFAQQPCAKKQSSRRFQQIARKCDHACLHAEHARHVGGARVAASALTHIRTVQPPAYEDRYADGAEQVPCGGREANFPNFHVAVSPVSRQRLPPFLLGIASNYHTR